jgi:2-amino-4-hydroxy-6-hydroxymethyldihydropteridine diphosphokinase
MDWPAWEPRYQAIMDDFGFSIRADQEAAKVLDALLHGKRLARDRDLRRVLEDMTVVVAGPALAGPLPEGDALISCDSAIEAVQARGAHPDVLVTDLDGALAAQVKANACCTLAVIHAHGDNIPALRAWVPQFPGLVLGTCQCEPIGGLRNFGGFTDGDRACFLAAHYGAEKVVLAGFDFEHPRPKPGKDPAVKARKLAWAKRLIAECGVPVEVA